MAHNEKWKSFGTTDQIAEAMSFHTAHNVENNVDTVSLINKGASCV